MNYRLKIVLLSISTLFLLFDLVVFVICRKTEVKQTGLKVFFAEHLFFMGAFAAGYVRVSPVKYGKRARKLEELYDSDLAGRISKNSFYASYTYVMIFLPALLSISVLADNVKLLFVFFVLLIFMCRYFDIWLDREINKKHACILCDFATVLSKMSLLINAGVTATEALEHVAFSSDGALYTELQRTVLEIKRGTSYDEALNGLNRRCGCKEIRKFTSAYMQNIVNGGPEFPIIISDMAISAWEGRKNRARLAGSAASQKLLIPIMLMFIGVLIMVIVPSFNTLLG